MSTTTRAKINCTIMKEDKMTTFFNDLGKLFYTIAAVEKKNSTRRNGSFKPTH